MLFNSLEFLLFLPIVVCLYYLLPHRHRWMLLLISSYYFYMSWKPEYAVLIAFSTVVGYVTALKMERTRNAVGRRLWLIASLVGNLAVLFTFKYANFFSGSLNSLLSFASVDWRSPTFSLLLPVGISFYTFQTLSYSIDIYRRKRAPERHLGVFAVYVSFFPQLVAGPIERSTRLLPQFRKRHRFLLRRVESGLLLILWGFFKKVVIADRVGLQVSAVYDNPELHRGWPVILATYFFAVQIYCDFSGYSDIAIGSARLMGVRLMTNFRQPYFSRSLAEFWQRWHISLSGWFRDYLYIPLGGSRVSRWRHTANLFVVFLVSGLWHGANWTFVMWGALHGVYIIASRWLGALWRRIRPAPVSHVPPVVKNVLMTAVTFHLVLPAWVVFRAGSIEDIAIIFARLPAISSSTPINIGITFSALAISLCAIALLLAVDGILASSHPYLRRIGRTVVFRYCAMLGLLILVLAGGMYTSADFIYFQF